MGSQLLLASTGFNVILGQGSGYLFNLSLQTAPIPVGWRRAIVIPVAKAARTTYPNLFRSITLASIQIIQKDTLHSH